MQPLDPLECGLPHREPFIFVDAVLALDPGQSAVCSKRFSAGEPFFKGHFPGRPLVPGVLLTEGAAQTAGIAAGEIGKAYHLSAIRQMKFIRPVVPDSVVEFSAAKTGGMGGMLQFQVSARVEGELVAEGIVILNEINITQKE
jgi:3-hydroxyacyl-[acyl-carrier-protein] dehydratase